MLDELAVGMAVSWLNLPRGGYGFALPTDAVVLRVCAKRVRIKVLLRDGRDVERVVSPLSLRPRSA